MSKISKVIHVGGLDATLTRKCFLPPNMIFSLEAVSLMETANEDARRFGRKSIGLDHLFLAVSTLSAASIAFGRQNVPFDRPLAHMEKMIQTGNETADTKELPLNDIAEEVIRLAEAFAGNSRDKLILPFHILKAGAKPAVDMPRCSVALLFRQLEIAPIRFFQDVSECEDL